MLSELIKEWNHWVAWDIVHGRKVPINPKGSSPDYASVSDRFTWGTFQRAYHCAEHFDLKGVGYVFTEDDPFVGVDLDGCRDPETGDIEGWAIEIIEWFDSYTEVSQSGTGVHIIGRGDLQRARKDNDQGVEVYSQGRFFCFTGDHIGWTLERARECQDAIGWMEDEYFPNRLSQTDDHQLDLMRTRNDDGWMVDKESWLKDALEAIDPDCSYDDWISVGMALHDGFDGSDEGLQLWDTWSQEGEKYEGTQDLLSSWRAFNSDGPSKTLKSIWWLAECYGWHWSPESDREAINKLLNSAHKDVDDEGEAEITHEVEDDDEDENLFVSYSDTYRDRSPYPDFLIEPALIGPGDMGLWFGPPKSYKTMSTMAMARQFAQGGDWHAMSANRPLTIAHLNFEMKVDRVRTRQHLTWHSKDELDTIQDRYYYTRRYGRRLSQDVLEELVDRAEREIPRHIDILVVDPAVNFFPGDNENDNVEVSRFLNGLRTLANAMGSEDTALILVHHTGKTEYSNPFKEIRGASAFRGAYDSAIHLHGDPDENHVVHLQSEVRNGRGMGDFTIRFCPSTGRFVSEHGEGIESPWTAGQRDIAQAIIKKVYLSAEEGVLFTKAKMCEEIAASSKLDITSKRSARRFVNNMLQRGLLAYFDPDDYGGPAAHPNSAGYLCANHMTYHDQKVSPDTYVPPTESAKPIPLDDRWWGSNNPEEDGPWCGYADPNEFVLTDMMTLD